MAALIDITGQRFGKLVAVRYERKKGWICQCDCGNERVISQSWYIRAGWAVSCGCYYPKTKQVGLEQGSKKD